MELGRTGSSSGRSSNLLCCRGVDGGSSLVGGTRSADSVPSSLIAAAVGESGGVTSSAEGGIRKSGRSGCLLIGDSRLWSSLISGGESGGIVGFSGWFGGSTCRPNTRPVEEILGFGARGGLDRWRQSSLGVSLDEEETDV